TPSDPWPRIGCAGLPDVRLQRRPLNESRCLSPLRPRPRSSSISRMSRNRFQASAGGSRNFSRKRFARASDRCDEIRDSGRQMDSRFLMTLQVAVVGAQKIGAVPHGTRVTAPITSGHFEGPRLRGKVLPGGGDWTLLRADGVLELDLRITLETDDGALIHMASFGLRHGPPE